MTLITYATQHCDDCKKLCDVDTLTTYNIASDGYGLLLRSFCDKCLSKYPKSDPRDWRREDHPDAFGIITWNDGTKSFKDDDGVLHDVLTIGDGIDAIVSDEGNLFDDEEEEFVPSIENFLSDVPNHLVAALCLLIIVLSGAGLLILLASKAVAK